MIPVAPTGNGRFFASLDISTTGDTEAEAEARAKLIEMVRAWLAENVQAAAATEKGE